jgi:hypothetical protein
VPRWFSSCSIADQFRLCAAFPPTAVMSVFLQLPPIPVICSESRHESRPNRLDIASRVVQKSQG